MVPKLCRELSLIKLMIPPKGILMIHSYGEARDHFVCPPFPQFLFEAAITMVSAFAPRIRCYADFSRVQSESESESTSPAITLVHTQGTIKKISPKTSTPSIYFFWVAFVETRS